ncbi:MAG: HEAT repeat domain-containing protein [Planctomycetia bacterium]|nr:HEAT repeat domain-containing protein [Planctomycetia bacterium]
MLARRALVAAPLLGCILGCAEGWRLRTEVLPPQDPSQALAEATVTDAPREASAAAGDDPLAQDSWARRVSTGDALTPSRHWRHVALESADGTLLIDEDSLRENLDSKDKLTAANARLLLMRSTDAAGQDEDASRQLRELIADARLSAPLRAAAVETLAELNSGTPRDAWVELLGGSGTGGLAFRAQPVEVRVELVRRGAAVFEPAASMAFTEALSDPEPAVRVAAVEAWAKAKPSAAPPQLVDLASDLDPGVRAATVSTLAAMESPLAAEAARAGFRDPQLEVRLAAIAALGKIKDPSSDAFLHEAASSEGNMVRAAAVEALAVRGDEAAVFAAAKDNDSMVRTAAARALRHVKAQHGAAIARTLIADRSMSVRRAAIQAVGTWPLADAGPLLFEGLDDGAVDTRKAAHESLKIIWPAAAEFRYSSDAATRAAALAALREQWHTSQGSNSTANEIVREASPPLLETHELAEEQLRELLAALTDATADNDPAALAAMQRANTHLESQLLDWTDRESQPIPENVYSEVLASRNEAIGQLADWESLSAQERRLRVSAVAQQASDKPLTPLAARRLIERVLLADDPLLWQSALDACRTQADASTRRFAAAALSHPTPDVRRRACEFFIEQPGIDAVTWLAPALEDETSYVAATAALAIGRCGEPQDLGSLAALCGHRDADCRLAAAETLAAWQDDRGAAALERLALDLDPAVRIRAAEAMGRIASAEFVPMLIAMLDDDLGVRRAALASLPSVAGETPIAADELPAPPLAEQVTRWKSWAAKQGELRR